MPIAKPKRKDRRFRTAGTFAGERRAASLQIVLPISELLTFPIEAFANMAQQEEFVARLRDRLGADATLSVREIAKEVSIYYTVRTHYILKLAGANWFAGDLPADPRVALDVLVNRSKSRPSDQHLDRVEEQCVGLTIRQLAEQCRALRQPAWVAVERERVRQAQSKKTRKGQ